MMYRLVLDAFGGFALEAEQKRFEILLQFIEHGSSAEIKVRTSLEKKRK